MNEEITNKKKYINIYKCFFIIYCFLSLFCMLFIISIIDEETLKYPAWISDIKTAAYLNIIPPILIFIISRFAKRYNWKLVVNIIVNLLFLLFALIMYYFVPVCSALYYELALKKF